MDFFQLLMIIALAIGGILVLFSVFNFRGKQDDAPADYAIAVEERLAQNLTAYQSSVSEAGEAISELNQVSNTVFKEFDSKYQELLFLYNLIEEKKQELGDIKSAPAGVGAVSDVPKAAIKPDYIVDDLAKRAANPKSPINPKYAHVLELAGQGMDADKIAQQLNMGKGEVMLILNLGGGVGA